MAGIETKRKVNLLGEAGVGKTSLTLRFVKDVFGEEYLKTIGTNVYTKKLSISNSEVKLIIYDIMGETGFESVRDRAFEKSTGAIAVADSTRKETLDKLINDWLPKYKKSAVDDAPIILAINKVDLEDQEITEESLPQVVHSVFDSVFFTSAKTSENVEEMFQELGFKSIYSRWVHKGLIQKRESLEESEIETLLEDETIDEPKKLISVLLTYASELGDISYGTREKIFEESGIDKFSLEDETVSEQQAVSFGEGLIQWYEDNNDEKSGAAIKRVLKKYEEDS